MDANGIRHTCFISGIFLRVMPLQVHGEKGSRSGSIGGSAGRGLHGSELWRHRNRLYDR